MNNDVGKICTNCGTTLGEEDVFCTNCGMKREVILEQSSPGEDVSVNHDEVGTICTNCGATLGEGDVFCTNCGVKHEIILEQSSPEEEVSVNHDEVGNVCANCGATLGEGDVFCTNCGVKQEVILEQSSPEEDVILEQSNPEEEVILEQSSSVEEVILEPSRPVEEVIAKPVDEKKGKKKTIIIIAVIVSLAVLGVVIFMLVSGTPINQFKSALNSGDIAGAIVLYDENAGDPKFVTKASNITKDYIADVQNDYMSDKTTYEYAFKALTEIDDIAEIGAAKTSLKDVKESKHFFTLAEKAINQKDYATALAYYNLIIEEDTSNYETAQKIIPETIELLCASTLDIVNESIAKGNYAAAYKTLMGIDTNYTNDELKALLREITSKANEEIESTAQTMLDDADYPGAYKYLEALGTELISSKAKNIMASAYDLFSAQKLAEAEEKALTGDYQGASTLLITATRKINVTEFSTKAQEYQIEADRIAQKVFVVSSYAYDDISRKARVLVKNNSEQVVKKFNIKILLFDKNGDPVFPDNPYVTGNVYSGYADPANIQPGSTFGNDAWWDINVGIAGTQIKACIFDAEFKDGTSWTNPNYKKWLELERNQY